MPASEPCSAHLSAAVLFDLHRDGAVPCAHVHSLLLTELNDIRERQRDLADLETGIVHLVSRSGRLQPAECSDAQVCHIIASNA